jgi:hypothetical protein
LYPRANFGGQNEGLDGTSTRNDCHVVFVTNDSVAAVTAFYGRELNTGNWQVTSSAAGQFGWRLTSGKRTTASGTLTIAVTGDRTEIKVDAYP